VALFENLKVIVSMGAGYHRLDRVTLGRRGVMICSCPGKPTLPIDSFSTHLALHRRLRHDRSSESCHCTGSLPLTGILLHQDGQRTLTPPKAASYLRTPHSPYYYPHIWDLWSGANRQSGPVVREGSWLGHSPFLPSFPTKPNNKHRALGIRRVRTKEELFDGVTH
jgi:hypothetical protein